MAIDFLNKNKKKSSSDKKNSNKREVFKKNKSHHDNNQNIIYRNKDGTYFGTFLNNTKNGRGKMVYTNGDVYEGEWNNNKKNGHGKMIYSNGDVHEGFWEKDNKKNGYCKMIYSNGDVYEGEWKDNKRKGKMVYANGIVCEGEWKDGDENGYCKCVYKNGDVYEGECKNYKRDGKGIMIYKEDKYKCECFWKNDKKDGYGIMYIDDEKHLQKWENGKLKNTIEFNIDIDIDLDCFEKFLALSIDDDDSLSRNEFCELRCPISLDCMDEPVITNCGHVFSKSSLKGLMRNTRKCPLCRQSINFFNKNKEIEDKLSEKYFVINDIRISLQEFQKYKDFLIS
jgi:hypothetical protein